ncbi:MAG: hypothetical protein ACW987_17785 [Candidatus Thorarchaeota archaeon]
MERAVEPESKRIEYELEIETEEEIEITFPETKEIETARIKRSTLLYAQSLSGFVVMASLLFVPVFTLPVMIILVLVAEVYLLDWTYSKVSMIRDSKSFISNESTGKSPEDEIDRKVARTGPKDSLVR